MRNSPWSANIRGCVMPRPAIGCYSRSPRSRAHRRRHQPEGGGSQSGRWSAAQQDRQAAFRAYIPRAVRYRGRKAVQAHLAQVKATGRAERSSPRSTRASRKPWSAPLCSVRRTPRIFWCGCLPCRRTSAEPRSGSKLFGGREPARRLRRDRPRSAHSHGQSRLPRSRRVGERGAGARRAARSLGGPARRGSQRTDRQPARARLGPPFLHHHARRVWLQRGGRDLGRVGAQRRASLLRLHHPQRRRSKPSSRGVRASCRARSSN